MARRAPEIEVDSHGNAFVMIGGVRVQLCTEAEGETCSYVVCGPWSHFADDVHTTCAHCGAPVVHRPSAPVGPPKICMACASADAPRRRV